MRIALKPVEYHLKSRSQPPEAGSYGAYRLRGVDLESGFGTAMREHADRQLKDHLFVGLSLRGAGPPSAHQMMESRAQTRGHAVNLADGRHDPFLHHRHCLLR